VERLVRERKKKFLRKEWRVEDIVRINRKKSNIEEEIISREREKLRYRGRKD